MKTVSGKTFIISCIALLSAIFISACGDDNSSSVPDSSLESSSSVEDIEKHRHNLALPSPILHPVPKAVPAQLQAQRTTVPLIFDTSITMTTQTKNSPYLKITPTTNANI